MEKGNVYGKPVSKSERLALGAVLGALEQGGVILPTPLAAATTGASQEPSVLRATLLDYIKARVCCYSLAAVGFLTIRPTLIHSILHTLCVTHRRPQLQRRRHCLW